MRCFFLFLTFLLLFCPRPVLADYASAYTDYTYNFTKYRDAHNAYDVAKSAYATYRTLTAQQDATTRLRSVLAARDKLMAAYFDLLYEKFLATPALSSGEQNTFFNVKESEKKWLADHQKKLDAASTLDDLNRASADFESRFPQMDTETKQAVGTVLLSKTDVLTTRWDAQANSLTEELKMIAAAGENTGPGQQGIISARNKKELAVNKFDLARKAFAGANYQTIDLFSAQQKLTEGTQYLREATQFLQEVVKNITG